MLHLLGALLLASAVPGAAETLRARFLGNAAFEITDGQITLLSDFPYRSGAFDYMTYDPAELRARSPALCLITHAHADHFEAGLVSPLGCRVLGPPDVLAQAPPASAVSLAPTISWSKLVITPVETDHGPAGHFSYLVDWKGVRLYFTGDTESTAELAAQGALDALFITPWLLRSALAAHALPKAARVIVYHHRAGEKAPACPTCLVPRQGQTIEIAGSR